MGIGFSAYNAVVCFEDYVGKGQGILTLGITSTVDRYRTGIGLAIAVYGKALV